MKVSTARICLDCDEVFDGDAKGFYRSVCPSCANKETVLLSKFLQPLPVLKIRKEEVGPMRPESKRG